MAESKGKALLQKAFLALLLMSGVGGLIYAALPEAYCSLEDSTVKYIYMSDSHKTVTKIVPFTDDDGNENYNILDDRCQKGRTIGEWIKVTGKSIKEASVGRVQTVGYVNNCDTGETDKYFCDEVGPNAECFQDDLIEMPYDEDYLY